MEDEAARDIFARTRGFHITTINPDPSRTVPQSEGNPMRVDPLSTEMTFLRLSQILNRFQRPKCNATYCLRARKRTSDPARDMGGAAAVIEAAKAANPEKECRFNFPRALRELAAVPGRKASHTTFSRRPGMTNLMNHFNPAIILGWLANIDISLCTSLQAVITYAAKYCSKSEKTRESYCKLADQDLRHTTHLQPLLSFSSRLMNKLIAERDYSAQEIFPSAAVRWSNMRPVGLCNSARGTVYGIGWAPWADPVQGLPCGIMMEFDKYSGPVFLTTADGRKIVPILPVEGHFLIGTTRCTRTQFALIVCHAITVHKSQSITEEVIVTAAGTFRLVSTT
ncbi:ATP-dependent DNA helicase PIF1, partial [Metarhizium majus ARSEF 297]